MREQLEKRITELESEYLAGQEMFADLEAKRTELQHTLLRISGAIQVLKELLGSGGSTGNGAGPAQPDDQLPQPDQYPVTPSPSPVGG